MSDGEKLNGLSGAVIGCVFGAAFLEKGNAPAHELRKRGLAVVRRGCMNYPRATGLQLCLLLNFGEPRLEIKRVANYL